MVLGTAKLKQRNSTISPSTRGRDVAKEMTARKNFTKEFTIVSYETKYIVILAQEEDHSYRLSSDAFQRYQKHWFSH